MSRERQREPLRDAKRKKPKHDKLYKAMLELWELAEHLVQRRFTETHDNFRATPQAKDGGENI